MYQFGDEQGKKIRSSSVRNMYQFGDEQGKKIRSRCVRNMYQFGDEQGKEKLKYVRKFFHFFHPADFISMKTF